MWMFSLTLRKKIQCLAHLSFTVKDFPASHFITAFSALSRKGSLRAAFVITGWVPWQNPEKYNIVLHPQQRFELTTVVFVNLVPFYVTLHMKKWANNTQNMHHHESFLPIGKTSWTKQSNSDLHSGTGALPFQTRFRHSVHLLSPELEWLFSTTQSLVQLKAEPEPQMFPFLIWCWLRSPDGFSIAAH